MESIAAALNISKRTLQRGLEKDGTQFKDVLNDVRRQMADFYLRHSHFNMKHVTCLLGFHDHSSFHKACIRWFGMTPGQYRTDELSPVVEKVARVRSMNPIGLYRDQKIAGSAERMHR
jgi:AraC-like DNA-binding protein